MIKKNCSVCKKEITKQNFSTHKKTVKHRINLEKSEPLNLLDDLKEEEINIKYFRLKLEELKNNVINNLEHIENILSKV